MDDPYDSLVKHIGSLPDLPKYENFDDKYRYCFSLEALSYTVLELLEVLGFDNIYDALVARVLEKGLWKEEWGEPPLIVVKVK